jgi:hypothetical protein
MKFTINSDAEKIITRDISNIMRKYSPKALLDLEATVEGQREKNDIVLLKIAKYIIEQKIKKETFK